MVYVADLPPFMQERVTCSIAAAEKYHLPPHYLLAIANAKTVVPVNRYAIPTAPMM